MPAVELQSSRVDPEVVPDAGGALSADGGDPETVSSEIGDVLPFDADADEVRACLALLLVEIVEDVVQMPARENLVRFEDREVIKQNFHGDPHIGWVR